MKFIHYKDKSTINIEGLISFNKSNNRRGDPTIRFVYLLKSGTTTYASSEYWVFDDGYNNEDININDKALAKNTEVRDDVYKRIQMLYSSEIKIKADEVLPKIKVEF
jgi:hypothetical protein